jgi:hypothetical protein
MVDRLESAWRATGHALHLVAEGVVAIDPWWLMAGVLLHVVHQGVRSRGWFNIIRAAYPELRELRARDVTSAYLVGVGLNSALPARGGDLAKVWLIRRRAPEMRWSTLLATMVPETLFETFVGLVLVGWALWHGLLPVPAADAELPSLDVSLVISHPFTSVAALAATAGAIVLFVRMVRRRARVLLARLRLGLAILNRPRDFLCGVVTWQALGRVIRVGSLACFLAAFALPVSAATVVLVMAAQGGTRVIPIAPASAGLRVVLLAYGFAAVTGEPIDIAQITAFAFGVGAALNIAALAISQTILARELGIRAPRRLLTGMRERVNEALATEAAPQP